MAENWNSVKLGNQKRPSIELTCDFAPLVLATENLQLCKVESKNTENSEREYLFVSFN